MTHINHLGFEQEIAILSNAWKTSEESKLYINLMSFISIGLITLILLIAIYSFILSYRRIYLPLLGKIEDRKIRVLKFFNLLNLD